MVALRVKPDTLAAVALSLKLDQLAVVAWRVKDYVVQVENW